MIVEGWIEMLHCAGCGATQPNWIFSADTDMATSGLVSAGDQRGSRLVLSMSPGAGNSKELRIAKFKRAESNLPDAAGLSFAEFRQQFVPSSLVFTCPWCEEGEMTSKRSLTSREFLAEGGRLDCRDGIAIREGN